MRFEQIIEDLKNKIYYPIYFLIGEEPYYIDVISNFIEQNVLSETEKDFNQTIVYGRDTDVQTIISYAKQFPIMSNYQVIIVKEAQDIEELRDKKIKNKGIEYLSKYIENPLKSTILVICYKYNKIDKIKKYSKLIEKKGVLFESKKLYDNKISDWISNYLKQRGYKISPNACMLLSENLGTDLGKIVNEISKLLINIPKDSKITEDIIEQNIGISKDFNIFEFQKALGRKDVFKANQIVNYFASNPKENPIIKIIIILYNFFSKVLIYHQLKDKSRKNTASKLSINPFFVYDYQLAARNYNIQKLCNIISYLREYDLKSKGVGNDSTNGGELLKELTYKILH